MKKPNTCAKCDWNPNAECAGDTGCHKFLNGCCCDDCIRREELQHDRHLLYSALVEDYDGS